jgi:hypothetical protein
MYELFILCRTRPPAPPGGFNAVEGQVGVDELPVDAYWKTIGDAFLRGGGELRAVFRVHRTDAESGVAMQSLGRAIADAGHGVALERQPVTMPWRFDLDHEGREPPADWPAVMARAEEYSEGERKAIEEHRRKLAEEKARWEARMRPEDLKEMDFTDAFSVLNSGPTKK